MSVNLIRRRWVVRENPRAFDVSTWEEMYPVLKEYAQRLGVTFYISNELGNSSIPNDNGGRLDIRIDGYRHDNGHEVVDTIYGVECRGRHWVLARPALGGLDIVDGKGTVVAQVFGSTVYVLFELLNDNRQVAYLTRQILEGYIELMGSDSYEEVRAERQLLAAENSPMLMQNVLTKKAQEELTEARRNSKRLGEKIDDLKKRLEDTRRDYRLAQEQLLSLEASAKEVTPEEAQTVLESLSGVSADGVVIVTEKYIKLNVGQIDIEYEGEVYDIGEFEIYLYFDGSSHGLRCLNLTRAIGEYEGEDYAHPHVMASGDCCLGSIDDLMPRLMRQGDYVAAAVMAREFLRTYSDENPYIIIDNWPVKE